MRDPKNVAVIQFVRPLETESDLTLDLKEGTTYIIYLSWAIFDSKDTAVDEKGLVGGQILVRGDTITQVDPVTSEEK